MAWKLDEGKPPYKRDVIWCDGQRYHLLLDPVPLPAGDGREMLILEPALKLVREAQAGDQSQSLDRLQRLHEQTKSNDAVLTRCLVVLKHCQARRAMLELDVPPDLAEQLIELDAQELEAKQQAALAMSKAQALRPVIDDAIATSISAQDRLIDDVLSKRLPLLQSVRDQLLSNISDSLSRALDLLYSLDRCIPLLQFPAGKVGCRQQVAAMLKAQPPAAPAPKEPAPARNDPPAAAVNEPEPLPSGEAPPQTNSPQLAPVYQPEPAR